MSTQLAFGSELKMLQHRFAKQRKWSSTQRGEGAGAEMRMFSSEYPDWREEGRLEQTPEFTPVPPILRGMK